MQKKKKKATGFCSFQKVFSWETDVWVTLGDVTVKKKKKKKKKNWEGKSVVNWKSIK